MTIWDLVYSLSEPNFWLSFSVSYHMTSNFAECRYYRTFPIACIVHADLTLTRSKIKVKVMWPWPPAPFRGFFLSIYVFSNHLIGRGQKSVWCVSVCMCVWTITFGQNNPWPRYLACWFNLTLSMLFSKVKVTGHSSGSQNEKCSFVGYGWILQGDCTFWIARCQHQTCTKCTVY